MRSPLRVNTRKTSSGDLPEITSLVLPRQSTQEDFLGLFACSSKGVVNYNSLCNNCNTRRSDCPSTPRASYLQS